jgi:DHA3 family macrolide efflux protein-like MFS transporter
MKTKGFTGFFVVWLGQFMSLFGSGMTSFALTLWIYQETGSPTALALSGFFATFPMLAFGTLSGALADRYARKRLLIASDTLAGLGTLSLLGVYLSGQMAVWHLYVVVFISGVAESVQLPAFMGSITMMVSKEHYGRASGMHQLAATASSIFSPIAAAALLGLVDLKVILCVDLATFGLAIFTIAITHIPQPPQTDVGQASRGNLRQDILYGFRFILARPSLRGLQTLWMSVNLLMTMGNVLLAALVLARTGSDEIVLSGVQAILSAGAVAGGLVISVWGGPRRKVRGAIVCLVLGALLGRVLFGLGRDLVTWAPGAFFSFLFVPILNGSLAAVWLAKVPPDVQGRVMSARITASRAMIPLGTLIAGPLAEKVFEPAMMPGGALAPAFGGWVGTGPGAGMSLILVLTGLLTAALGFVAYAIPAVRYAEDRLPDYAPVAAPAR